MSKLYYLTRTYKPLQSGGVFMRVKAVELLAKNGFEVAVVTPNYDRTKKEIEVVDNIIYIPLRHNLSLATLLERFGFYEDYLDPWIKNAFRHLERLITKNDIVFATCGGELGMFKLASLLKEKFGCRYAVNFRDPLDYSLVNGLKVNDAFHVSREKQEKRYLRNADLIITSTNVHRKALEQKYPELKEKLKTNYFGFIKKTELKPARPSKNLRILYGGTFGNLQSPEILAEAAAALSGIETYFIGHNRAYEPLKIFSGLFHFIPFMSHAPFVQFAMENIDAGFLSLGNEYLGACIPSKLYEYINLGLPMLAALPEGDAKEIIETRGYGVVCGYADTACLKNAIEKFKDPAFLQTCRNNILKDRNSWAMEEKIKEVVSWLRNLL